MGILICCSRFERGELSAFDPGVIDSAWAGCVVGREAGVLLLGLDGTGGLPLRLQLHGEPAVPHSFTIERPVEDERLYEALFAVLQQQRGSVAYAPESPPVVAAPGSADELPADLIEALGAACQVGSAQALKKALFDR